jgi:type I restriction enzyme S subunit
MSKQKLIPTLRFTEFENEGEWVETALGDLCYYWNGAGHEGGVSEDGDYNLISLNSIDIDGNLKDVMKKINYTDNSLQVNDLVMVLSDVAHGNFLGLTDIIPSDKYVLNQRMAGLRVKEIENTYPYFLRAYINKNQKYFKLKGQGSSQLNLSKSAVTEFPVIIPKDPNEQQKIASCLSSLDEVIAAHSQKLTLLKDHKKGLMQNLFPQAGEKVPRYRFKEFEEDGEWVEKTLGEIVNFLSGGTPSKEINEYWNGHIPWISASSMHDPIVVTSELKITDFAVKNGANIVKKGGLLILVRGSMLFKRIPICITATDVSFNQDVKSLELKKEIFNLFLLFLLVSKEAELLGLVSATGIGAGKIDTSDLKSLIIQIPSKSEQQKIASCLSSLDALITAQAEQIAQLKLHKKGLMQGLFPKIKD